MRLLLTLVLLLSSLSAQSAESVRVDFVTRLDEITSVPSGGTADLTLLANGTIRVEVSAGSKLVFALGFDTGLDVFPVFDTPPLYAQSRLIAGGELFSTSATAFQLPPPLSSFGFGVGAVGQFASVEDLITGNNNYGLLLWVVDPDGFRTETWVGNISAIPEPGTLALWTFGLGCAAAAARRRRIAR